MRGTQARFGHNRWQKANGCFFNSKTTMEKILENIKNLRKEKGLSQESVAFDLGIDYSTYGKLERGHISLSVERMIEIAEILNVPLLDLFILPMETLHGKNVFLENEKLKLDKELAIKTLTEAAAKLKALRPNVAGLGGMVAKINHTLETIK
jgi:transcriptional regulator with XRE-family HTH domain